MQTEELYKIYKQFPSVQTDTRKLKQGDIFFALKGDNFNGNQFAGQAIEAGAAYAVIDEAAFAIEGKTILVPDVLKALQDLAKHHRQQFSIPFVAITGSNGKTTSKELVNAVLSAAFRTSTTEGNLNNHIGIPLTLLKIKSDAEIAVIEMGANHQREIAGYCEYVQPTHGIITNCGKAHLEGFGGEAGVRKGKGELFDYLRAYNGTAFIMADYDYLREMSAGIKEVICYGSNSASIESCANEKSNADANVIGTVSKSDPFLEVALELDNQSAQTFLQTQLVGDYNLPNVLLAVTVGKYFKVPMEKIVTAISNYTPSNSRSQLITKDSNQIILDAYNANPSSMRLAIENFNSIKATYKILMLGAMAELGEESLEEHKAIVSLIKKYKFETVVLVGGDFQKIDHPFMKFDTAADAKQWFNEQHFKNCHILIKGSRSQKMETILNN